MEIEPILSIILLALGLASGYYVADRRYQAVVGAASAFFEEVQCYWRAKADGQITLAEEQEIGRSSVRFFDRLMDLGIDLRK
jgi:hypothetical protein